MKTCVSKTLSALALVAVATVAACDSDAGGPRVIVPGRDGEIAVAVEIADTPAERSLGLMYRRDLDAHAGMLFLFDDTAVRSFWMRNTPLPLDMIFIDEQQRVVGIVHDAVPFTTTPRAVDAPSRYVLEVHAGFSARHGLAAGDQLRFEDVPGVAPVP